MIKLKIDVTKIDKTKLYTGAKGTYLDAVLIETKDNKFGDDYVIIQELSKEDREAGLKGAILGNARNLKKSEGQAKQSAPRDDDDSLPF